MSKMLLPTEEDTAMSPSPLRATMTEVIRSGTDVPAAKNDNPIICQLFNVLILLISNCKIPKMTVFGNEAVYVTSVLMSRVLPISLVHHSIR